MIESLGMKRQGYPSDVSEEEWAFVASYLTLMREDAPQRVYPLRTIFNAVRWLVRTGAAWRLLPNDLPPWELVYQQTQRWVRAGVFDSMVNALRIVVRLCAGRSAEPTAAIFDSRTLQSTPQSGARAGYDGAKRKRGSKVHLAVDTLGHLLALHVSLANEQDRAHVPQLAAEVQQATDQHVQVAFVDQRYTGVQTEQAANQQGLHLHVVKLSQAKHGFVLLPRRWVVERSFAWTARFRRLARDFERLPTPLAGLHLLAFGIILLQRLNLSS